MTQTRKKYSQEFKQETVQLVTERGYTVAEAAKNLGIREGMLWRWKKEYLQKGSASFSGNGKAADTPETELRRL